jgi:hypothetical protein
MEIKAPRRGLKRSDSALPDRNALENFVGAEKS